LKNLVLGQKKQYFFVTISLLTYRNPMRIPNPKHCIKEGKKGWYFSPCWQCRGIWRSADARTRTAPTSSFSSSSLRL